MIRTFRSLGWLACVAALSFACGGDDDDGSSGGAGGAAPIGAACATSGADGQCAAGAVCGKPGDGSTTLACLKACTSQSDCGAGEECNGVEGSATKGCRPKKGAGGAGGAAGGAGAAGVGGAAGGAAGAAGAGG